MDETQPTPPALRVLVVDDEEEILELLGEYLKARGFVVRTAYDGLDALEVLQVGGADVVLSDMKMPGMGGLELLEEARRMPRPVAVILMTGFGTVESATRALKQGAYDYLLKPFKLKDVYAAILRAAARLEQERAVARMRQLLQFYELSHQVEDPDELPRLYGLLASVARDELQAVEVAVWLRGPDGWEAVARGGRVSALASLDPDRFFEPAVEGAIAVAPVLLARGPVGLLAVAGGQDIDPALLPRLSLLARVFGETLERLGWQSGG